MHCRGGEVSVLAQSSTRRGQGTRHAPAGNWRRCTCICWRRRKRSDWDCGLAVRPIFQGEDALRGAHLYLAPCLPPTCQPRGPSATYTCRAATGRNCPWRYMQPELQLLLDEFHRQLAAPLPPMAPRGRCDPSFAAV